MNLQQKFCGLGGMNFSWVHLDKVHDFLGKIRTKTLPLQMLRIGGVIVYSEWSHPTDFKKPHEYCICRHPSTISDDEWRPACIKVELRRQLEIFIWVPLCSGPGNKRNKIKPQIKTIYDWLSIKCLVQTWSCSTNIKREHKLTDFKSDIVYLCLWHCLTFVNGSTFWVGFHNA